MSLHLFIYDVQTQEKNVSGSLSDFFLGDRKEVIGDNTGTIEYFRFNLQKKIGFGDNLFNIF